jgi:hypothetical protein
MPCTGRKGFFGGAKAGCGCAMKPFLGTCGQACLYVVVRASPFDVWAIGRPIESLLGWVAEPVGAGAPVRQEGSRTSTEESDARWIGGLDDSSRAGVAMSAADPVAQFSRTESEIVAAQYRAWVYPQPVADMAQAVATGQYWDLSDPSLFRRKALAAKDRARRSQHPDRWLRNQPGRLLYQGRFLPRRPISHLA